MIRATLKFTATNHIVTGVLLIVIAALLAWLSSRYTFEADWTRNNRHTLSDASVKVLSMAEDAIKITAYAREQQTLRATIRKIVGKYQRIKPDIELHFVNPDAVPDEARELGLKVDGELVINYQGRSEHVRSDSEEEFTNAILRLLKGSTRWLAFTEGHGERNPLGRANHDIGEWGQYLNSRGFNIQPINLLHTRAIPDNTTALVIAGPLVDFLPVEVELIINYLNGGGNLLWLTEPNKLYGLDAIAAYLDIEFPKGTIVDATGQLSGINEPTIALITDKLYEQHPALEAFSFTTLFPRTAAISSQQSDQWLIRSLIRTSDLSWLERGQLKGELNFDQGQDIPGPLAIAVSLERQTTGKQGDGAVTGQQRIIVTGDGDFLSNTYIGNSGNLELGIRMINWVSSDDDFIPIPNIAAEDTYIDSQLTLGIIGIVLVFILPLTLLGTGMLIWWRRKKL